MITPKATFQKDPANKGFQDIVDSPVFHRAAQAALAQMTVVNIPAGDMGTAASMHYRIEGAKQFLDTLMDLGLAATEKPKVTYRNLNQL